MKDSIMLPDSNFSLSYQIFQFAFYLAFLWYSSLYLFFEFDKRFGEYEYDADLQIFWTTVLLFITTFDIYVGINTGYYDKKVLILSRNEVVKNYVNSKLPLDALTVMAAFVNRAYFPDSNKTIAYIINLFIFCKSYVIIAFLNNIDTIFQISKQYQYVVDIFKLLVKVILCSHLMAILYHVIFIYFLYFFYIYFLAMCNFRYIFLWNIIRNLASLSKYC